MKLMKWLCLLPCLVLPVAAQDNVTIPKSRLEELERKEQELNKLKGDVKKTKQENAQLKQKAAEAAAKAAAAPTAQPVVAHVSPPLAGLPPLKENDVVDSMDLANYYKADAAAADQRFLGHKFRLRGEVIGFEKPPLKRNFKILLKTPDRDTRVICDFYPPEQFNAVFSANHGSELVALQGETRVPLLKVGEVVSLRAECKGWHKSEVRIAGADLRRLP